MQTQRNTGSTPLRASRIARVITALGRAAVAGSLATIMACADAPSAILAPSEASATRDLITSTLAKVHVKGLLRDVPLKGAPQTRSWTVSARRGGLLSWPEVGLVVVVPPKAINESEMTLTVTAMPGAVVAYEFGPHGSKFAAPLVVVQSLVGTNFARLGDDARLRGGYFRNASQINQATGSAEIDESLPAVLGFRDLFVSFKVTHFSGYMVSTD